MTRSPVVLLGLLLVACGGSDAGPTELVDLGVEPAGDNCEAGGVAVHTGQDDDDDGALSDDEIEATTYVCDPPDDAGTTIVTVEEEPAGVNCDEGGVAIHTGVDADGDGALSAGEVDETQYVCDVAAPHDVILGNVLVASAADAAVLSGARVVTGRIVVEALGLEELDLSTLEEVGGDLEILEASVAAVDAPALTVVGGNLRLTTAEATSIDLGGLERVGRDFEIDEEELTSIDLSSLQKVGSPANQGDLLIYGKLADLSLPELTYVARFTTLQGELETITVASLEHAYSFGLHNLPSLVSIDVPSLESADFLGIGDTGTLAVVTGFPSLALVGELTVSRNDGLTDLDLPALTDVTTLRIEDNPLLPTCDAEALSDQVTPNSSAISGNDDAGTCP